MLCELSLLFSKKEGAEEQFPDVVENYHYEKLWNHLDKRELRNLGSTKVCLTLRIKMFIIKCICFHCANKCERLLPLQVFLKNFHCEFKICMEL